jgi:hypothetical protein
LEVCTCGRVVHVHASILENLFGEMSATCDFVDLVP